MSRDEALIWLETWREMYVPTKDLDFSERCLTHITSGTKNVYLNSLINLLEDQIRTGEDDPITEVAKYHYEMKEILELADLKDRRKQQFASFMEESSDDILWFLKKKEKEKRQK